MYCQNCGAKVTGKFCSNCGAKIITPDDAGNNNAGATVSPDNKYESLMKRPDVRDLISKYAAQSPHKLSAEDFMKLADLAYKPVMGMSMTSLSEVVVPIFQKLGIETGKSFEETVPLSIDETVIKVMCSLAKNGYTLNTVDQANDGIIFHASIPSDLLTWGGDLLVTLQEQEKNTRLIINVKIKGQLYDWGKSKAIINKITNDMVTIKLPVLPGAAEINPV